MTPREILEELCMNLDCPVYRDVVNSALSSLAEWMESEKIQYKDGSYDWFCGHNSAIDHLIKKLNSN